jgi:hypothetical protein
MDMKEAYAYANKKVFLEDFHRDKLMIITKKYFLIFNKSEKIKMFKKN